MKFDIDCDFYVQNVIEHKFSWNKYFIMYQRNTAKHFTSSCNTSISPVIQLKVRLFQYLILHSHQKLTVSLPINQE